MGQQNATLVLDMSLDEDLLSMGSARDIIRRFRQSGNGPEDRGGDLTGDALGPVRPSWQRMTGITFSLRLGPLRVS